MFCCIDRAHHNRKQTYHLAESAGQGENSGPSLILLDNHHQTETNTIPKFKHMINKLDKPKKKKKDKIRSFENNNIKWLNKTIE